MTIQRKTLRCWARDLLLNRTRAGSRVVASRYDPILPDIELAGATDFVSLSVYTLTETMERHTDTPRTYKRRVELVVEIWAQAGPALGAEALDDLVDEVGDQVECVIDPEIPQLLQLEVPGEGYFAVNPSLSGLERTEIGFDASGRQIDASARLVWAIHYGTDTDERAQARATDLERLHVTYRFPPIDDSLPPAAEDDIDVPTE